MSFKRKIITALTAAVAVIAFSNLAFSQDTKTENPTQPAKKERREMRPGRFGDREGCRGMRRGRMGQRHGLMRGLRGLNLTEEQKTQIRTLMQNRRQNPAVDREQLRTLMVAKRDGTITAEQQQQLETFRNTMKENARRDRESVLALLTAEQKAQLEARKAEMKRRMDERKQMRDQKKPAPVVKPDVKKDN